MSDKSAPREHTTLGDIMDELAEVKDAIGVEDGMVITEARIPPKEGTVKYDILEQVDNKGPVPARNINTENRVSRSLSELYTSYILNREDRDGEFYYTVSKLGSLILEDDNGQKTLEDTTSSDPDPDPWDDADINRGQYVALQLVSDYGGHPESSDIEEEFLSNGFTCDSSSLAVSTRLSGLYSKGYVGRTPERPYYYWVTEDGYDLLE